VWKKVVQLRKTRKEQGQSMVEFALVIPLLLLLMVGIFEFGYFFFVYSSVTMAAREAARYGSGTGANDDLVRYFQDCDGIKERARRIGQYAGIQDDDVDIFYDTGPGSTPLGDCNGILEPTMGERVVVKVSVDYHPIVLKWGALDGLLIESESARTIIHRMQVGG